MKPKRTKTLVIVILAIAGLLGLVAIGTAIYYSQLDDVTPAPTDASPDLNKCVEFYAMVPDANGDYVPLTPDQPINVNQPVRFGARFQSPAGEKAGAAAQFEKFEFIINNEHKVEVDVDDQLRTETTNESLQLFPEFLFSDYEQLGENADTITINVVPHGEVLGGETDVLDNVGRCLPEIFALSSEPLPDQEAVCLEAGETQTDYCADLEEGEKCNIPVPTCCAGLVRVDNCTEPDAEDQCTREIPNCFICLTDVSDGICNAEEGENICNSPADCHSPIAPPAGACHVNADCPVGEQCTEGKCAPAPVDECAVNAECATGEMCQGGSCVPDPSYECSTNADCSNGQICQMNKCVETAPPQQGICSSDNDCDPGKVCSLGECVPAAPPGEEPGSGTNSEFTVSVNGAVCVERIAPANGVDLTITITNGAESYQEIMQVKNKLPLGFTYVAGSSVINGQADTSDQYATVQNVGNSQEIVWSTSGGWSVAPGDQFIIQFKALAGNNAITGEALNEVVVTPLNNPIDAKSLRTESSINVAQSCSTPQTAIFGDMADRIILGILIIAAAVMFYTHSSGKRATEALITSERLTGSAKKAEMLYLKATQPREYFEKKVRDNEEE